ncbi:suppressor of glycerol defect [Physocladia obscura]|uniref:Suppressor of glycerol defect n=1 Tax=Physocladia obscura TaxID=109957 RepID=A0AAD5SRT4_9FUNG|nr:suppressor of glycerol defect [Physocladia obscura]
MKGKSNNARRQTAKKEDTTTKLPAAMQAMLATPATSASTSDLSEKQQRELDKRFNLQYKKKDLYGRKEARKKKREEKKQNRNQLAVARVQFKKNGGKIPNSIAETFAKVSVIASNVNEKPVVESKTAPKLKKSANLDTQQKSSHQDDLATTQRKLAKIQQTNPAMYKMLQSTSVGIETGIGGRFAGGGVGDFSADGSSHMDKDNEDIEYYSRKLGRKEKTIKNSLKKDGLDDLFEDLSEDPQDIKSLRAERATTKDSEKKPMAQKDSGRWKKNHEKSAESESDQEFDNAKDLEVNESEGEDELKNFDDLMDGLESGGSSSDDEDSADDFNFGSEEDMSDVELNMESENESDNENDNDDNDDDSDTSEEITKKSTKTKTEETAKVFPSAKNSESPKIESTSGKYIPPRLRAQNTGQSEQYQRLKRTVQGLLNKLSDSNIESIVTGLEECYRNNSRHG